MTFSSSRWKKGPVSVPSIPPTGVEGAAGERVKEKSKSGKSEPGGREAAAHPTHTHTPFFATERDFF